MKPQTIGRALGIVVRITGQYVGRKIVGPPQSATPGMRTAVAAEPTVAGSVRSASQRAVQSRHAVSKGVGGFLRPFRRVGGILWLEVTGVFFLLPVLVFAPTLWRARMSWAHGPDHRTFIVSAVVIAIFSYLGMSSFWRARQR